jgi:hypothetical protein
LATPPDAARLSFLHAFTPGRRLTYAVDYRSEALVDGALEHVPLGENAPRADSVLTLSSSFGGTLTLAVVERRPDGSALVLATFRDLAVNVVASSRSITLAEDTFAPLARGFLVEYGPNGDVHGIAVEEGAHPVAIRLASQVVAFLQLEAPRDHGATWETDEKDPLGDLHARYTVLDEAPSRGDGQLIQKAVTRRIGPRATGALGRLIATGGSATTATLAYEVSPEHGILFEAAGELTTEHMLGELRVGTDDSTFVVRLERDEQGLAAEVRAQARARAVALGELRPLDPTQLRAEERRAENEALLSRVDFGAVLADARMHPPPPQSRDAATYARLLSAAVETSDLARALLEKTMLDPAVGERAFVPLARAFGEHDSPESQAVLARVVNGRTKEDPGREVALFSLGRANAPSDATIALLEAVAQAKDDPCAYAALLALGRAAGQLAAIEPRRGRPVFERLLARVSAAPDDGTRAKALEAIGNAGSPLAEPELARWRASTVPASVRGAAVSAHRLIPTTSARDALIDALGKDSDAAVRSAALEAVVLRRPDDAIADAVADRLEHDTDESVKKPAASRLMSLCRRNERACTHIERLKREGDEWTRHELASFERR